MQLPSELSFAEVSSRCIPSKRLQRSPCVQLRCNLRSDRSHGRCCYRLNYERYHSWADQVAVPAALTFDGPAYKGLQAENMDDASLQYLQRHLRILCGLYGVLRPLDALKPYRFETRSLMFDADQDFRQCRKGPVCTSTILQARDGDEGQDWQRIQPVRILARRHC
jgi:hypothetical protein